jgi:hypothetical protein
MHLQSKFTIIRPKKYKKSLLCGLISQTSAEKPPKNGGVRKANCRDLYLRVNSRRYKHYLCHSQQGQTYNALLIVAD